MRKAATKASDETIAARKRNMRNQPTKAEFKVWQMIKDKALGVKFLRQERLGGRNDDHIYADFVCHERGVIIEVDNPSNAERANDIARNEFFAKLNYDVLRLKDRDILGNPNAVLVKIKAILAANAPH